MFQLKPLIIFRVIVNPGKKKKRSLLTKSNEK